MDKFNEYKEAEDFVGMDMARKFVSRRRKIESPRLVFTLPADADGLHPSEEVRQSQG